MSDSNATARHTLPSYYASVSKVLGDLTQAGTLTKRREAHMCAFFKNQRWGVITHHWFDAQGDIITKSEDDYALLYNARSFEEIDSLLTEMGVKWVSRQPADAWPYKRQRYFAFN